MNNEEQAKSYQTESRPEEILDGADCQTEEEASLGKFKSSEALLNAYNNLEAEFTKRSQRLKELETIKPENSVQQATEPAYMDPTWQTQVQEFIIKNPVATNYAEEIAAEIINDDALSKDKHCLSLALDRVLARKFAPPESMVEDEEFINNYVLKSDKIKNLIIDEYLESIHRPPDVIVRKGEIPLTPPVKPKSLSEAKELAHKLFDRR